MNVSVTILLYIVSMLVYLKYAHNVFATAAFS